MIIIRRPIPIPKAVRWPVSYQNVYVAFFWIFFQQGLIFVLYVVPIPL